MGEERIRKELKAHLKTNEPEWNTTKGSQNERNKQGFKERAPCGKSNRGVKGMTRKTVTGHDLDNMSDVTV